MQNENTDERLASLQSDLKELVDKQEVKALAFIYVYAWTDEFGEAHLTVGDTERGNSTARRALLGEAIKKF